VEKPVEEGSRRDVQHGMEELPAKFSAHRPNDFRSRDLVPANARLTAGANAVVSQWCALSVGSHLSAYRPDSILRREQRRSDQPHHHRNDQGRQGNAQEHDECRTDPRRNQAQGIKSKPATMTSGKGEMMGRWPTRKLKKAPPELSDPQRRPQVRPSTGKGLRPRPTAA
jgi:hypothetical protein